MRIPSSVPLDNCDSARNLTRAPAAASPRRACALDGLVHGLRVARVVRRRADEHLEDERAEAPVVDRIRVADTGKYLRRHVARRAAACARACGQRRDGLLGQPKVGKAHVARGIEQHVLWLEVAEHNV
eukprot:1090643-Pleurochrysis_carterae.AAC.1